MALPSAAATGLYGLSLIELAPNGPGVSLVLANNILVRGTSSKVGKCKLRNGGLVTRPLSSTTTSSNSAERLRHAAFNLCTALHRIDQIAVAEFSVERIGQEIVTLYDELLNRGAKSLQSGRIAV